MFNSLLSNLKAGLKTAFKGGNDTLDTATRNMISKFTKGVANVVIKRFPKLEKSTAQMAGTSAILLGWLIRQGTRLGPFGDNFVTDVAQEIADRLDDITEKDPKATPEQLADKKKLMANIAKLLINAQIRFASHIDVEAFFAEFNILMSQMNEKNQMAFVEMLSKFNAREMVSFMTLTTEEKKKFFSPFLSKDDPSTDVDPKSLADLIRSTKETMSSAFDEIAEVATTVAKKIDDQFVPGSTLSNQAKRFKRWANNIK